MMAESIITMTTEACAHIQSMINRAPEKRLFRLWIKKTGCNGYMYMPEMVVQQQEGDTLVEVSSELTVAIAASAVNMIKGTKIHFEQKSFGMQQLTFANPNAEGLCGCGESFNLKEGHDE